MVNNSNINTEIMLTPIGRVLNDIKEPMLQTGESDFDPSVRMERVKHYYRQVENSLGRLVIHDEWVDLLDGIEAFSHILVLYWPHLIEPKRRQLHKVYPMGRRDIPMQGIFATRSPARPNPVLVSVVRLLGRKGNTLNVAGLDAVDGSPLIDIKPYLKPRGGELGATAPEWMKQLHRDLGIETEASGGKP